MTAEAVAAVTGSFFFWSTIPGGWTGARIAEKNLFQTTAVDWRGEISMASDRFFPLKGKRISKGKETERWRQLFIVIFSFHRGFPVTLPLCFSHHISSSSFLFCSCESLLLLPSNHSSTSRPQQKTWADNNIFFSAMPFCVCAHHVFVVRINSQAFIRLTRWDVASFSFSTPLLPVRSFICLSHHHHHRRRCFSFCCHV